MITFREILKDAEDREETHLFTSLNQIFTEGLSTYLPLLGESGDSYIGIPHIQNIENHINRFVPDKIKKKFTISEIFTLLAAIQLHDIGKKLPYAGIKDREDKETHSQKSCNFILKNWAFLKIPSFQFARWISIVACSHTWKGPLHPPNKCDYRAGGGKEPECGLTCSEQQNDLILAHLSDDGPVRLERIAALLRLGDDVDNISTRTLPAWLSNDKAKSEISHWRSLVKSVFFDEAGCCIKLRTQDFPDTADWKRQSVDKNGAQTVKPYLKHALEAVWQTNEILKNWESPLYEIGLEYKEAYIESGSTLYRVIKKADVYSYEENALEFSLNPDLINRIKAAINRIHNGVINGNPFSWISLAAECGINNTALVKTGLLRIKGNGEYKNLIVSRNGWYFDPGIIKEPLTINENGEGAKETSHVTLISTGMRELDYLLCPEPPTPWANKREKRKTGFYAPIDPTNKEKWLPPIIVIEGGSGDGKTTLATQIALNLVARMETDNNLPWLSIFYSLEQPPERIQTSMEGYGFFCTARQKKEEPLRRQDGNEIRNIILNLENEPWQKLVSKILQEPIKSGRLILPRVTQGFAGQHGITPDEMFDQRYNEFKAAISFFHENFKNPDFPEQKRNLFFFIDSISAFSIEPLKRNQINRLFSLFRQYEVPLIVSLERQREWARTEEIVPYNVARYLADIVIRLWSGEQDNYYRQTIEVTKTRYNRRILGKHQVKIKSPEHLTTDGFDDRCGFVIFPSIHSHFSKMYSQKKSMKTLPALINKEHLPIGIDQPREYHTFQDSCYVISGKHGGHKLALGFNILLNNSLDKRKRKLIISMAEEREIDLNEIALYNTIREEWKECMVKNDASGKSVSDISDGLDTEHSNAKIWKQDFGSTEGDIYFTVLNFRVGQIMPEEFLYIIKEHIDQNEDIDSVLFYDTAHIKNRFPSLSSNPLFFPAVVDIIKDAGLSSIFIDVMEKEGYNQSLMAVADCRIYINKDHIKKKVSPGGGAESIDYEVTTIQVNNVRGKVYDRKLRYIDVIVAEDKHKELIICNPSNSDELTKFKELIFHSEVE